MQIISEYIAIFLVLVIQPLLVRSSSYQGKENPHFNLFPDFNSFFVFHVWFCKSCEFKIVSENIDCYNLKDDPKGLEYRGYESKTEGGLLCQKWTSQSPNAHDRTPEM